MNDNDRNNLEFLLSITPATFAEWFAQTSEDDLSYAQDLLDAHAIELGTRSAELLLECELELSDCAEANAVLDKFRL